MFSMAKNKTGFPILEEGRGVIPFDPQLQSTAVLVGEASTDCEEGRG